MKNTMNKLLKRMRPRRRAKDTIIISCQQVRSSVLNIRNALQKFQSVLTERGDREALQVVGKLEGLAKHAFRRISDRLLRLTGAAEAIPIAESPFEFREVPGATWSPTTWTGIHAELLTYLVQSIEVCRNALSVQGMSFDHVTRYVLIQVLELLEEMLWVVESNPADANEKGINVGQENKEKGRSQKRVNFCALFSSDPADTLKIVPGEIALSGNIEEEYAVFIPRADSTARFTLSEEIAKRVTGVHPERQALFGGCTHIVEVSIEELSSFGDEMERFIKRPLLESALPVYDTVANSS
ncbi:MAG: hypothetical protein K1X79_04420 [Oligoflexia bacterium]|nr:hypothetical protein [Oligoflexia bacterium]